MEDASWESRTWYRICGDQFSRVRVTLRELGFGLGLDLGMVAPGIGCLTTGSDRHCVKSTCTGGRSRLGGVGRVRSGRKGGVWAVVAHLVPDLWRPVQPDSVGQLLVRQHNVARLEPHLRRVFRRKRRPVSAPLVACGGIVACGGKRRDMCALHSLRDNVIVGLGGECDAQQQLEGRHVRMLLHPVNVPLVLVLRRPAKAALWQGEAQRDLASHLRAKLARDELLCEAARRAGVQQVVDGRRMPGPNFTRELLLSVVVLFPRGAALA
eukprot:scaffold3345_cov117-Isochrysis_galbana.AAC.3